MTGKRIVFITVLIIIFSACSAFGELFPSVLTNREPKESAPVKNDENLTREKLSVSVDSRTAGAYLIYPKRKDDKKLPSVLFLHTEDEGLEAQLGRMEILARYGYAVFCLDWHDTRGVVEAFNFMRKHPVIDETCISILGAHQGATEAILLGCTQRYHVKAVIAIAGMPPYEMEGKDPAGSIWAPVLLVHGEVDSQLPVSVSRYFYFNLKDKNRTAETFILPFARHYFNDIEWSQVLEQTHKFIKKHVLEVPPDKRYRPEDFRREIPR